MSSSDAQASCRALFVGSVIGVLLCFSNMWFGLQTGWVTMASIQAAVLGFGVIRSWDELCRRWIGTHARAEHVPSGSIATEQDARSQQRCTSLGTKEEQDTLLADG